MTSQVTRKNHYVPQWYQRGFLETGQTQLYYLDISPVPKTLDDGRVVTTSGLNRRSPKGCFWSFDLYSTHLGSEVNDEIERLLFGSIDDQGAAAIRAFSSGVT